MSRIALASDHAGFDMKAALVPWLQGQGHELVDLGAANGAASADYPNFGYKLAKVVADGNADLGIAICGSGIGISIAVNRHPDCRCARVGDALSARLAREHNDANVLALGARLIGIDTAKDCITQFLATPFGGDRHTARVRKLSNPLFEDAE